MQGEPHEEIVTFAEEEGYDLIALGVKGYNVSEKILMGSTTARVIGYGNTSVLVIPWGSRLIWERVLVPVDGSASSQAAARLAFQFVDAYGLDLTVLSVADVPLHLYGVSGEAANEMIADAKSHLDQIAREMESRGIKAEYLLREGEPAKTIVDLAGKRETDLIIMGSHGRTGLTRLLMGSVTESVIQGSPCPILVIRSAESTATDAVTQCRIA